MYAGMEDSGTLASICSFATMRSRSAAAPVKVVILIGTPPVLQLRY